MITKGAKAGDVLPGIEKTITQERIMGWARISGDFNRLHVDPEYARGTPFKGTIAHGPMSLAFLNELMMKCFGVAWVNGGKLMDVRFVAPIRPGDAIRVGGTIEDIREEDGGAVAVCNMSIEKSGGEKAVVGRAVAGIAGEA